MRSTFVKLLAPLDALPVENLLTNPPQCNGTPDVNFMGGWCELKYLPEYPKRANTLVRIDCYHDGQREWGMRRHLAGEPTYLCLLVSPSDWYVWKQPEAQKVGFMTRQEMVDCALFFSKKKPTSEQLCAVFRRPA